MNIILYLLSIIQYLYQQNCWLINFICRYIPLKQWAFDDSHSPNYQKFRVDQLPKIQIIHHEWDWCLLIPYFEHRYNVKIKPVSRRKECDIPQDCSCPSCSAPQPYLYRNNGKAGQLKCKVCNTNFSPGENRFAKQFTLRCPHCGKALAAKKERKHFILHKCVNPKCPYYLHNLKKVDKADRNEDYGKNKYKLHYIYRQFTIDFFRMELSSLPKNAKRILLVEDEKKILKMFERALKGAGYEVTAVSNSLEAKKLLQEKRFDVVVTDYAMPGMNGGQLAALIQKMGLACRVIMITGLVEDQVLEYYRSHLIDMLLVKPLEVQTLIDAIEREEHSS